MSTGSRGEYEGGSEHSARGDLAHTRDGQLCGKAVCTSHLFVKGEYVGTKDQRTSRLNMRLTPLELSTIREAAAAAQVSVSAFMLSAALEKAGAQRPAPSSAE